MYIYIKQNAKDNIFAIFNYQNITHKTLLIYTQVCTVHVIHSPKVHIHAIHTCTMCLFRVEVIFMLLTPPKSV